MAERPHGDDPADVIEFNARNADRMMPIFGQDLLVKANEKSPSPPPPA